MSIVARIFTLIALMLLLVASGVLFNGLTLRQNRLKELRVDTEQLARVSEFDLIRILDGTYQLLGTLARLPVHGWDERACALLEATASADFEYDHLVAVDVNGIVECSSSGRSQTGIIVSDRKFLDRVFATRKLVVGMYGRGQLSGNEVLRVGQARVNDAGTVIGAVYAGINLTWLNTEVSRWQLGKNVRIYVADRNGILIASNSDAASIGGPISDDLKPFLFAKEIGTTETIKAGGVRELYGYVPVGAGPSAEFGIFVGRNVAAAIADINRSIFLNIAVALAGLIVSGVFAAVYIRHILALPFQNLLLAASRWRAGDWSARAGSGRNVPEFERLAAAFDGMAGEVSARDLALREREVILNAIAKCAAELVPAGTLAKAIPRILQTMGEAMGADRVIVLEVPPVGSPTILRYAWQGPAVSVEVHAEYFAALPSEVSAELALELHRESGVVNLRRCDVRGAVKDLFERFGIESNLQAPFSVDGTLFGVVAIDDCRVQRPWTPIEIEAASVLANLIGAAIARDRHLERISNADVVARNSPAIVYRMAANVSPPQITYVSDNIALTGNDPAELTGDIGRIIARIHPDDRSTVKSAITAATTGPGTAGSVEFRIADAGGTYHWVENRYNPMRDSEGRLLEIAGVLLDITARKATQEKLLFANTLLSTLTETMPDGIVVVDSDKKIISSNRRFSEIWRLRPALVETMDDVAVLSSVATSVKDPEAFAARVNYLYEHTWESAQDELETVDGKFLDRRTASLRADGQYLGRVWFFRDVTESRQAFERTQAMLERARRQLQMLGFLSKAESLISGDVDRLAQQITEQVTEVIGCERVNIWLFNDDATELRCIDLYEASSGTHSAGMVLQEPEFRHELRLLKDVLYIASDDALTNCGATGYAETYLKQHRISSKLDTLIEIGGRHLGLLCFEYVGGPHRWEHDEIVFARQIADKIGHGILVRQRGNEEEKRRLSEAALAGAQKIAHLGSWSFDAATKEASFSAESSRILGVDSATFGRTYEAYLSRVHPDDRARYAHAISDGITGQKGYVAEYRLVMDDGSIKWIHDIGENVYDSLGRHLGMTGTMQDIT
ncbi:MAG TPA: PAS domain-containing protein, partial [Xanthobacteraceae bacterium]|nr:PAS domain-containing protein [Xanthobacteraceae bacterium]